MTEPGRDRDVRLKELPEDWTRAVAIAAHPDDLEYGAASAIARWTAQGKEVSYVLVTSGEAGIDGLRPEQCGPLREGEERAGAALVGVDHVEFLGHPDGAVEYGARLRQGIAGSIRRLRPEVVVTLSFDLTWGDEGIVNHADHRAVGLAVVDACRDAANRWVAPELGEPWQGVQHLVVNGATPATHFVNVTASLQRGVESLRAHRAYLEGLGNDFDPAAFLTESAGEAGKAAGCEFAVTFRRYAV